MRPEDVFSKNRPHHNSPHQLSLEMMAYTIIPPALLKNAGSKCTTMADKILTLNKTNNLSELQFFFAFFYSKNVLYLFLKLLSFILAVFLSPIFIIFIKYKQRNFIYLNM